MLKRILMMALGGLAIHQLQKRGLLDRQPGDRTAAPSGVAPTPATDAVDTEPAAAWPDPAPSRS